MPEYFPDLIDNDFFLGNDSKDARAVIDYAVSHYNSNYQARMQMEKNYEDFNGFIRKEELDAIEKSTGKQSKTAFVKYKLGRPKMKLLHGEFLKQRISAQAVTINRNSVNKKMDKYKKAYGMSLAKEHIEKVREIGYDVFTGIKIQDKKDKQLWSLNNFKSQNEIVMNKILKDKLLTKKLKRVFYDNFVDMTITNIPFGKIEMDVNGIDSFRRINPKYAIFLETTNDPFLTRTPFIGEKRYMYIHEIMNEFNLTKDQKKSIKNYESSHDSDDKRGYTRINSKMSIPVYTIEWKALEPVYKKTESSKYRNVTYKSIVSNEMYNKKKSYYNSGVKNDKFDIDVKYKEVVYTGTLIGNLNEIYTDIRPVENMIQMHDDNWMYTAKYNYAGLLFNTVDGTRISLQEVMSELERIYDKIRYKINKEIDKIRGSVLKYDEAFIPKHKTFTDIIHDIDEKGVVRYNSSSDGNKGVVDAQGDHVGISEINLGSNQALLTLLNNALDIEQTMDKLTGINRSRQGFGAASSTATTNTTNVEASNTMTFDLFWFMNQFVQEVLERLIEKTKFNKAVLKEDSRMFVYSDDDLHFMEATKDIQNDDFALIINDGRTENEILEKLEAMFLQEINAGLLRTKDVAKFWMADSFSEAIQVLDIAHVNYEKIRMEESKMNLQAKENDSARRYNLATEDREDRQEHEKEIVVLKSEADKEKDLNRAMYESGHISQKGKNEKMNKDENVQPPDSF